MNQSKNNIEQDGGSRRVQQTVSNSDGKGLTIYFVIGRYGGLRFKKDGMAFRITLGWIGFAIVLCDIEILIDKMMKHIDQLNGNIG